MLELELGLRVVELLCEQGGSADRYHRVGHHYWRGCSQPGSFRLGSLHTTTVWKSIGSLGQRPSFTVQRSCFSQDNLVAAHLVEHSIIITLGQLTTTARIPV